MRQTVHERLGLGFRVSGFGFWAVEQIMPQTVHERLYGETRVAYGFRQTAALATALGFRVQGLGRRVSRFD